MVAIAKIKAGDILYDVHRVKMGNTTESRVAVYRVKVLSIDHSGQSATVICNSNPSAVWYGNKLRRLVRTPPKGTYERVMHDAEKARVAK